MGLDDSEKMCTATSTRAPIVAVSHWVTAGREEGGAEVKEKDHTCCKSFFSASIPSLL